MENQKIILHLTVTRQWFEVMVTGEKAFEIREKSNWIKSRLFNKDGTKRHYDLVSITNGYGKDKPNFVAEYKGFEEISEAYWAYSNGAVLDFVDDRYMIHLGKIQSISNYQTLTA